MSYIEYEFFISIGIFMQNVPHYHILNWYINMIIVSNSFIKYYKYF